MSAMNIITTRDDDLVGTVPNMIEPGSLSAEKIVRQRAGGDCVIAVLATVLALPAA